MTRLSKKEALLLADRLPEDVRAWLSSAPREPDASVGNVDVKTKRKGVKPNPVLSSFENARVEAKFDGESFAFVARGVRLFSLNEIYSMLQTRAFIVFSYKKKCRKLVRDAMRACSATRIQGPCRIILHRVGKRKVDRDSIPVMFKALIDALRDEKDFPGILVDDNPDEVVDIVVRQSVGEPCIAMRVERVAVPETFPDDPSDSVFLPFSETSAWPD